MARSNTTKLMPLRMEGVHGGIAIAVLSMHDYCLQDNKSYEAHLVQEVCGIHMLFQPPHLQSCGRAGRWSVPPAVCLACEAF